MMRLFYEVCSALMITLPFTRSLNVIAYDCPRTVHQSVNKYLWKACYEPVIVLDTKWTSSWIGWHIFLNLSEVANLFFFLLFLPLGSINDFDCLWWYLGVCHASAESEAWKCSHFSLWCWSNRHHQSSVIGEKNKGVYSAYLSCLLTY